VVPSAHQTYRQAYARKKKVVAIILKQAKGVGPPSEVVPLSTPVSYGFLMSMPASEVAIIGLYLAYY